jgi:hypothetical protein
MFSRRLLETLAMAIIGDSVLCVVAPRRHTGLWLGGPVWWRKVWRPFVDHPTLTRLLGAAGVAFGLWLARTQEPSPAGVATDELGGPNDKYSGHYLLRRARELVER